LTAPGEIPEVIKKVEKQDLDIGLVGGPVPGEGLSWRTIFGPDILAF
jgi:hypothetical protein